MKNHISTSKVSYAAIALFVAVIVYRLGTALAGSHSGWLPNFSPLAAIALCGAIYLPRRIALVLPMAVLFASDLVLNAHYGASLVSIEMVSRYVVLAGVAAAGFALRSSPGFAKVLLTSVAGSIAFYVITNTGSWIGDAAYAKTFAGWLQALTWGEPGYASTWTFFRNTLVSDTLFTAVFVGCMAVANARITAPVPARQAV